MLYGGPAFVEPHQAVTRGGFMPAAERAGIHIAYFAFQVRGLMPVAVKDQQRRMPAQQGVKVGYRLAHRPGGNLAAA